MASWKALLLVTLFVLLFRLIVSSGADMYSVDSYFHIRQVESIHDTFVPIIEDNLIQGGRDVVISPGMHYILAFLSFLIPLKFVLWFVPQLFASLSALFGGLVVGKITGRPWIALVTGLGIGILPSFVSETVYSVNPLSFVLPLFLLFIFAYLNYKENNSRGSLYTILTLACFLPLVSAYSLVLVLGFLVYLVLALLQRIKVERKEYEIILFFLLVTFWVIFVLYSPALKILGIAVLWQNIPRELMLDFFSSIEPIQYIAFIGLVPLIFGLKAMYNYVFEKANSSISVIIGFGLASFFVMYFKLIQPKIGLLFVGCSLTILSGAYINDLWSYWEKTKLYQWKSISFLVILGLMITTSFVSAISFSSSHEVISDNFGKDYVKLAEL